MNVERLLEKGVLPDFLIRFGIRQRLQQKLDEENKASISVKTFAEALRQDPIAVHTRDANEQHYELPPEFFIKVLGGRLKYSCGFWSNSCQDLCESELEMLKLYVARAGLRDGQTVLDLGCGWGSLSLFLAERFPKTRITAVSNSKDQKDFIESRARERGFHNLQVMTADMNEFDCEETFDRIMSIEMLEHMHNYQKLFEKIAKWLKVDGKFFAHIFCHKQYAYHFTHDKDSDWMGKYFFTGGIMPSFDLFDRFQEHLEIRERWKINGKHYEKTSNAWLKRMDSARGELDGLFKDVYGAEHDKWRHYWRMFFMACAELFAFNHGEEWFVGHYLMEKKS